MQFKKALLLLALISIAISSAKKDKKKKESKEKVSKYVIMPPEAEDHDPCLQPRPQRSNGTNANFWFYYNQEKRRCETFPYDGHVVAQETKNSWRNFKVQNRFEFFQDCFRECNGHMKLGELQVKNPKECFEPIATCRMRCDNEKSKVYFTFIQADLECKEVRLCCPVGERNLYSTLNDCRKNCHFTSE